MAVKKNPMSKGTPKFVAGGKGSGHTVTYPGKGGAGMSDKFIPKGKPKAR